MIKLFKNGKELCEVNEYNFYPGKQEITYFNPIGGPRIPIRGRKDTDIVAFLTSIRPELQSKHELRDDEGNSRSIIIENIEHKQNKFFVKATID